MYGGDVLVYRPTVRYDDSFKEYVDSLFHSTTLDRNQIMRLALFLLGHTKEGKDVLNHFATSTLPSPKWTVNDMVVWYGKEVNFKIAAGETLTPEGVTSIVEENSLSGPERPTARRERTIHEETDDKPIIFRIGNSILLPRRE